MTIAAILLAAGESTRMGHPKQLLEWDGSTLVAWQVRQLFEAGVEDVVVVLGHRAEEIRGAVPPKARVVINEAYKAGRATSLRRGAEALAPETEAVLVLGVDQPRPAWLSRLLIERWRRSRAAVVSPRFRGGNGHPVLVDGALLGELRQVSDETLGLRAVIERHAVETEAVEIVNDALNVDLNTPADYEAALAAYQRGEWQKPTE